MDTWGNKSILGHETVLNIIQINNYLSLDLIGVVTNVLFMNLPYILFKIVLADNFVCIYVLFTI